MVVGVDVLDLDFWVQVDSIEQPIKSNSVGPGNKSHCGTSSLKNHLDRFVVLKQTHSIKLLAAKIGRLWEHGQHYSKRRTFLEIAALARDLRHGFLRSIMVLSRVSKD